MELIAVVAAAHPEEGGRYNTRQEDAVIDRYLRAARRAKALLILDIQPGRSDFYTETVRLERWLKEPDVGLAIDPEWRMGPDEVPGNVIGSVEAREVNATSAWLAQLVERHDLPEKLFLIHQFTDDMVDDTRLQERPGLAMVLNADGFGGQAIKKGEVPCVHALAAPVLPQGLQALLPRGHRPHEPAPGAAAAAAARRRDLRVTLRLPDPCLVVLVGATGAGKSAWAGAWFHADQIVSSDRLRAVVGAGERDQRASRDAFEVLDLIVAKRLRRGLTTVVDSTGLEPKRRAAWRALAEREGVPAYAIVLDTPEKVVRERNRARGTPVPGQGRRRPAARGGRRARGARGRGLRGRPRRGAGRARAARVPGRPGGGRPPGRGSAGARVRPPALALRVGGPPRRARSPTSREPPRRRASRACG